MKRHEGDPQHPEVRRRTYLQMLAVGAVAIASLSLLNHDTPPSGDTAPNYPRAKYESTPAWRQHFADLPTSRLDTSTWRYDTDYQVPGYNDEQQAYTDLAKNVRIEPGVGLVIEAHQEPYRYQTDPTARTYDYTSGRIDTLNSFNFEYGKIEAKMKLPEGAGVWPAFWLLSANEPHTQIEAQTGTNERSYMKNGEIDIMEYYGHTPGVIEATAHTYKKSVAGSINVPDAGDAFHTYGVEVAPNSITWTVDGTPYHSLTKSSDNPDDWPFGGGNRLYVLLNLAMGGTGGEVIQNEHGPWRMEIQDLSYYQYIDSTTAP